MNWAKAFLMATSPLWILGTIIAVDLLLWEDFVLWTLAALAAVLIGVTFWYLTVNIKKDLDRKDRGNSN
jgi:hypothetical protein